MLLLVSASNSQESINNHLLLEILRHKTFNYLDLNCCSSIPILSKDIQYKFGIPKEINDVYFELKKYSKLVFFTPEHNGYISAFFKNIVDWLSVLDIDFLNNKKVIVISASETQKTKRDMEDGVIKTFNKFSPKSVTFVNFNEYGLDKEKDLFRIKKFIDFHLN